MIPNVTQILNDISEGSVPISDTISLTISELESAQYKKLLKNYPLKILNLVFSEEETNDLQKLAKLLKENSISHIHFPIVIYKKLGDKIQLIKDEKLHEFYDCVIEKIHQKHDSSPKDNETITIDNEDLPASRKDSPKIQLKKLIKKKKDLLMYDHLIRVEEQFENMQAQEENVETQQEENVETQTQAIDTFNGELIDFEKFKQEPFSNIIKNQNLYNVFKKELFGNLPKAIKYTSKEAALMLAKNASSYVSLNADNLPEGFILKKTNLGEIVLDYSQDAVENHIGNAFTPKPAYSVSEELIYDYYHLPPKDLHDLEYMGIKDTKKCHNLWIKYGKEGLNKFSETLWACGEDNQGKLNSFLQKNYLNRFPQWDIFLDDKDALPAMLRMREYSPLKFKCLEQFWPNQKDSTLFKLTDLLIAYEEFWQEWQDLARQNNIDESAILNAWQKPQNGNPVVYMERLLSILKNARCLSEQLALNESITLKRVDENKDLDLIINNFVKKPTIIKQGGKYFIYVCQNGLGWRIRELNHQIMQEEALQFPDVNNEKQVLLTQKDSKLLQEIKPLMNAHHREDKIPLDNYGAYYASKYENFKTVTKEMNLVYDPAIQNKWSFNPEGFIYRVSLGELVNDFNHNKNGSNEALKDVQENYDKKLKQLYRFLGLCTTGINARYYISNLEQYLDEFDSIQINGIKLKKINLALLSLFFLTHERYEGKIEPDRLLESLNGLDIQDEVLSKTLNDLYSLMKKDIKLNDIEGYALCGRIELMNNAAFETKPFENMKKHYIEKFFNKFLSNPQSVLKCCRKLAENIYDKWPFVYALDTAEYLSSDTTINIYYRDSLLLFTTLLRSTSSKENFYEGVKEQEVLNNLDQIRDFLLKAANEPSPNNYQYAYQRIIYANQYFDHQCCIKVYNQLQSIPKYAPMEVDNILTQNKFKLRAEPPKVFARDNQDVKVNLILLLMILERYEKESVFSWDPPKDVQEQINILEKSIKETQDPQKQSFLQTQYLDLNKQQEKRYAWNQQFENYKSLDFKTLQSKLNEQWNKNSALVSMISPTLLKPIFSQLRIDIFKQEFARLPQSDFSEKLMSKLDEMPTFNQINDFETLDRMGNQITTIVRLFVEIQSRENFKQNEEKLTNIISKANLNQYDFDTLYALCNTLEKMPKRDYSNILKIYFEVSNSWGVEKRQKLLYFIEQCSNKFLPSLYIERLIKLYDQVPNVENEEWRNFNNQIISQFEEDPNDPILTYLFDTNTLDFADCAAIIELTKTFKTSRFAIVEFLKALKDLKPILNELKDFPEILQIMAMSYATTISAKREQGLNDVLKLVKNLKKLNNNSFLENLNKLFQSFCFDLPCLSTNLQDFVKSPHQKNFNDLKILLEQSPFGKRDLKTQFNVTEVERVVNGFLDLNHQSMYQYYYRKKLMESFLFINRAGLDLPIYNNKPAKDLENKDLKELFQNVKKKQPAHLDDFQRRLYALGLLREIMYRTTGQFPYSTQMLSLIDCMMHQGDVISNIDTGQGKSLTDMMKVALLWLESDRVDLSTSSLVDAKRDLEFYDNYLKFLGIPHSSSPLTTSDLEKNFIPNGLNVSTLAQFSLVDSMAKVNNLKLKESVDKVSLVLNESDDAILDDRTVYRYATTDDSVALTQKQEWVYEAINDFVYTIPFVLDNTSQQEDIENLRQYLLQEAQKRKVSSRFIHEKLIDSQLLQWIESAILVNYRLRENFDYVVTETPMMKKVRGKECETYAIKILQKDGKLSSNNQYGNGIQQLLYAKLNKACGKQKFIIEPESKTIISSNNKNRIDYYRSKNGLIWGSSGTVGFGGEIDLQYHKFGFEFSKVAPHQAKQVKEYQPSILINEKEQFAAILKQIKTNLKSNKTRPNFLFFKDIETAKRFKQYLTEMDKNVKHQLFTGLGQEEEVIKKAAEPGMLTISTQALGRNTDVKYPKEGMNLIDTFVSQERNRIQRIGRTGRQGSKGRIHSIYNQEDFKGMSIAELKNSIEKVESQEREYNEDLFDIIGYLLSHVNKHSGDSRFFIDKWSSFSQSIEKSYHIEKSNQTYDKDSFMEKICEEFNSLITNTEIPTVIFKDFQSKLKEKHEKRPGYASYQKEIKLVDCVPAEWIAYQFVNSNANQGSEEHNNQASIAKFKALFHSIHPKKIQTLNQDYLYKDAVKAKLKVLFHSIHQKNFETLNQDYLQYVNLTNLETIKEAHQEFLQEYLQEQVKSSKHLSFVKRWMGFEGHLNRITQDSIYLFFFKAMVDVRQEPMAFDKVKPALETLLEEYTQYYWFVNKNRKQEVANLIEKIKAAKNYEELVNILIISKCSMMDIDLQKNLSSWRRIKPLHFFGQSRFQSVLDRALTLASTMGQQKITSEQIHQMFEKLTKKDNANELSIDELKNIIKTLKNTDRANAAVICKSIESAIKNNELKQNPNGMTGRIKPKNSS